MFVRHSEDGRNQYSVEWCLLSSVCLTQSRACERSVVIKLRILVGDFKLETNFTLSAIKIRISASHNMLPQHTITLFLGPSSEGKDAVANWSLHSVCPKNHTTAILKAIVFQRMVKTRDFFDYLASICRVGFGNVAGRHLY